MGTVTFECVFTGPRQRHYFDKQNGDFIAQTIHSIGVAFGSKPDYKPRALYGIGAHTPFQNKKVLAIISPSKLFNQNIFTVPAEIANNIQVYVNIGNKDTTTGQENTSTQTLPLRISNFQPNDHYKINVIYDPEKGFKLTLSQENEILPLTTQLIADNLSASGDTMDTNLFDWIISNYSALEIDHFLKNQKGYVVEPVRLDSNIPMRTKMMIGALKTHHSMVSASFKHQQLSVEDQKASNYDDVLYGSSHKPFLNDNTILNIICSYKISNNQVSVPALNKILQDYTTNEINEFLINHSPEKLTLPITTSNRDILAVQNILMALRFLLTLPPNTYISGKELNDPRITVMIDHFPQNTPEERQKFATICANICRQAIKNDNVDLSLEYFFKIPNEIEIYPAVRLQLNNFLLSKGIDLFNSSFLDNDGQNREPNN